MDREKQPLLPPSHSRLIATSATRSLYSFRRRWVVPSFIRAVAITMLMLAAFSSFLQWNNFAPEPPVCMSASCVHASSEILYNLHPNYDHIDPCTDTYQFICGGWSDRHDLRPDQGDASALSAMAEQGQLLLRHVVEAPYPGYEASSEYKSFAADEDNFVKLKDAYAACMDEKTIQEAGVGPLKDLLSEVSGLNITETVLKLMENGVGALASFYASGDDRDPDKIAVFVTPPRVIGLPSKEYYDDAKIVEEYKEVIAKVTTALISAKALPAEYSDLWATKSFTDSVVDFEKKLSQASPPPEDLESVVKYYNPYSLEESSKMLPQLSASRIISALAPSNFSTDRIIVGSPDYMKSVSKILEKTDNGTIHGYFMWKVVQAYASSVEDSAVKPLMQFKNKLQGKDPDSSPDRWRTCISVVDQDLGWILSRFYIQRAFSREAKEFGDVIIRDIKDQFKKTLKSTDWMSDSVRKLGIEKVNNIVQKIGYPTISPDIMNPDKLKEFYHSVSVDNSTFFKNRRAVAKFEVSREWSKLGKPTDRNEWDMTAPTVNAYFNPPGNEIVFPAGIMQAPVFYDPSVPQYLSYGAFGSISGHELSHAFDSSGRHYDTIGNYTNWWDNETINAFEQRAQCFVEQYGNFTVPGPDDKPLHVNGRLTLGENIADAGGLGAAFAAWKARDELTPDAKLPGLLHFTKEQLFMLSYGNSWCGMTRKEAAIQRIYQDPHSPKFARVIGTLANSRAFRDAFKCPVREPTCKLW